ncbi:MAG TPA: hypothetical protein VGD41_03325, partial [Pyrinomonadaceae bacterium]
DGPGFGKGGTGVLSVDGKEVASRTIPHTIPFVETIYETFDVGVDTRTGVDDNDYQPPFRFNGEIDKLYPAHTIIRNFFGSMTRKLSVTSSQ